MFGFLNFYHIKQQYAINNKFLHYIKWALLHRLILPGRQEWFGLSVSFRQRFSKDLTESWKTPAERWLSKAHCNKLVRIWWWLECLESCLCGVYGTFRLYHHHCLLQRVVPPSPPEPHDSCNTNQCSVVGFS